MSSCFSPSFSVSIVCVFLWVIPLRGKGTTGRQELGVWGLLDHCGPSSKKPPALLFPYKWWGPLSKALRLCLVVGEEWELCVRLGGRKEGTLFLIRPLSEIYDQ